MDSLLDFITGMATDSSFITLEASSDITTDGLSGSGSAEAAITGSVFGIQYLDLTVFATQDFGISEVDVTEASASGMAGYTVEVGDFGLGGDQLDTRIFFNGNPIVSLADTVQYSATSL